MANQRRFWKAAVAAAAPLLSAVVAWHICSTSANKVQTTQEARDTNPASGSISAEEAERAQDVTDANSASEQFNLPAGFSELFRFSEPAPEMFGFTFVDIPQNISVHDLGKGEDLKDLVVFLTGPDIERNIRYSMKSFDGNGIAELFRFPMPLRVRSDSGTNSTLSHPGKLLPFLVRGNCRYDSIALSRFTHGISGETRVSEIYETQIPQECDPNSIKPILMFSSGVDKRYFYPEVSDGNRLALKEFFEVPKKGVPEEFSIVNLEEARKRAREGNPLTYDCASVVKIGGPFTGEFARLVEEKKEEGFLQSQFGFRVRGYLRGEGGEGPWNSAVAYFNSRGDHALCFIIARSSRAGVLARVDSDTIGFSLEEYRKKWMQRPPPPAPRPRSRP